MSPTTAGAILMETWRTPDKQSPQVFIGKSKRVIDFYFEPIWPHTLIPTQPPQFPRLWYAILAIIVKPWNVARFSGIWDMKLHQNIDAHPLKLLSSV